VPNEIGVDIDVTGADDLKQVGLLGKRAGDDVAQGLKKGFAEAEAAATKATGGIRSSLDQIGEGASGALDGLTGGLVGGKAGMLGAGALLGTALLSGMQQAIEETRIGGLIAAQTGQATEAAGRLGALSGDIYADNFGESIEQVGESITALFQNEVVDTSAPEAAIENFSKKVLTVSQTTGEGVAEITRSAQQLVTTGMAGSFAQAMDIIQQATEQGLNVSGELLDTIDEYSIQFQRLGLDGAEAFGLIEQATDAGARNIDVVADALKEFAIQAQDATGNASRGFRTLGLDAADSMAAVAAGGEPAQEVLRQVLNRLQEMPPSVQRSTAAVDLFGTKAEDLGNALYAMDVDEVTESFGEFSGAVDQAGKTIESTTPGLDKLGRWFGDRLSDVGGFAVDMADTMAAGFTEMGEALFGSGEAADSAGDSMEDWGSETWGANEAAETLVQTMDDLISQQSELANSFIDSAEAQIDYNQALSDAEELVGRVNDGLNDTASGFDLTTEAGQNAQQAIDEVVTAGWDMVEALSADGASAEQLNSVIADSNTRLYELLVSMGVNSDAARVLADRLFGIPDVDPTVTLVDNASPNIDAIMSKMKALDGTWAYTYVQTIIQPPVNRSGTPADPANQGTIPFKAHGGITGAREHWGAATGGQRHGSTWMNEVGPELVELPDGSNVMTAGATRALAEAGAFGGGGPVQVNLVVEFGAGADTLMGQSFQQAVRKGYARFKTRSGEPVVVA